MREHAQRSGPLSINKGTGMRRMGDTDRVLLTITTTADAGAVSDKRPAGDPGYLLHKHPGRVQSFNLPVGRDVFHPEMTEHRCAISLLLEVDPVALVRGRKFGGSEAFSLGQYVNDRHDWRDQLCWALPVGHPTGPGSRRPEWDSRHRGHGRRAPLVTQHLRGGCQCKGSVLTRSG
jgi:hypothetical protein